MEDEEGRSKGGEGSAIKGREIRRGRKTIKRVEEEDGNRGIGRREIAVKSGEEDELKLEEQAVNNGTFVRLSWD